MITDENVILPDTLALLEKLAADPVTNQYRLVGGTALALQIGHRLSIDLDFFTQKEIDVQMLVEYLFEKYAFQVLNQASNTLIGVINDIKVDFIRHPYPDVGQNIVEGKIIMAPPEDIAAMKLNAIVNSGQRVKDFWDIYFLLQQMPMRSMVEYYTQKYSFANPVVALKAVSYFQDIDYKREPAKLVNNVPFKEVVKRIESSVVSLDKIY